MKNEHNQITIKFPNKELKETFMAWWLDVNGEQDFFDFLINNSDLENAENITTEWNTDEITFQENE